MKVSIVGITGYSGLELVRLLNNHKFTEVVSIHASKEIGRSLSDLYPHLQGICDLRIEPFDSDLIMAQADLVIFATPSGIAKDLAKAFVSANFPVIDMSGDHRLPKRLYEKWYEKPAADSEQQVQFCYGLVEFSQARQKKFIANPGCYATATELALIPLIKAGVIELDSVIVDAKSGLTGAGKALTESSHFVNVHDNYRTYKLNHHQHIPEIVQTLQSFDENFQQLQFSTSLLPVNRGIIATCYVRLKAPLTDEEIWTIYQQDYADKPFVRLHQNLPDLHHVIGSNLTAIGFRYNPVTNVLTVISVIDNLIKGASGQAMQNLNVMFGFSETEGFTKIPSHL